MPVFLAHREDNSIAGVEILDRLTLHLNARYALQSRAAIAVRVNMPVRDGLIFEDDAMQTCYRRVLVARRQERSAGRARERFRIRRAEGRVLMAKHLQDETLSSAEF